MPKGPIRNEKDCRLNVDFDVKSTQQLVRKSMWEFAGITRDANQLQHLMNILDDMGEIVLADGIEAFELQNMIDVAKLIARAALQRTESRGAHYRHDFPNENDAVWKRHIDLQYGDN